MFNAKRFLFKTRNFIPVNALEWAFVASARIDYAAKMKHFVADTITVLQLPPSATFKVCIVKDKNNLS